MNIINLERIGNISCCDIQAVFCLRCVKRNMLSVNEIRFLYLGKRISSTPSLVSQHKLHNLQDIL